MNSIDTSPLVSVIMPLYNAEKFITESINSVLEQTWQNLEIIIIDDGSTDKSFDIAKSFESGRLKVLQQANQGAGTARNTGLKAAKGRYIQFFDADDLLSPGKIEDQVKRLNASDDYVALCRTIHFDDGMDPRSGNLITDWFCIDTDDPVDFLLKLNAGYEAIYGYGGMIQPNAWLTPMAVIERAGPWKEYRCPDDDGEFFCRVLLASKGIRYSENALNYYRKFKHISTLSGQKSLEAYQNLALTIDLKHKYLKERKNEAIVDKVFARQYWELGVATYPKYKALSESLINKASEFGYAGVKYKSGALSTALGKLLGWRLMRSLSYIKHGF